MKLLKLKLHNFRNFKGTHEFEFSKLNFVSGRNGTGKSTISLFALLFGLYGYSHSSLASLVNKECKNCKVELTVSHEKDLYVVKRTYPTSVEIIKNEKNIKFSTSIEANNYIINLFGTRDNFVKFRIIDAYNSESDILSAGPSTIKKTLFGFCGEIFNNAKTKLQIIKSERDRLNKDGMTVYTHFPSEKRLDILNKGISETTNQYRDIVKELNEFERDYLTEERDKSKKDGLNYQYNSQKKKILADPEICYACKQPIAKTNQKSQVDEIESNIKELNSKIKEHVESLEMQKDIIHTYKSNKDELQARISSLNSIKIRLEARLKQKNLIYSTKDVLIVKKALVELDNLSSYYLKESIKVLEPIINSVLEKIGFAVKFTINNNKFTIVYTKDGIEYNQKDLSTGQATLMQIAFKLALLISQNKTGIIIADEGLGSLDKENLMHVVDIFSSYPFQLFLVLHNAPDMPNDVRVINLNKGE